MVLEHREEYGTQWSAISSIAPPTCHWHKARQADPGRPPPRVKRDACLRPEIQRVRDSNLQVYGARKVWLQLNREEIPAARCTVERLMRDMGLCGAVRGKRCRTTIPDESAGRTTDLVNREFSATGPNRLWGAD